MENSQIMKIKPKNWGQVKGGLNSPGNTKEFKIPKKDEKLAEFIGIILGDGHISYHRRYKVGAYSIRIAGHSENDYEYLANYVTNLSKDIFDMDAKLNKHQSENCIYLNLYGRKLVEFFGKMGLKSGNKIKNQSTIPKWIWKKDSYLKACIRGLYDTDGSVYELLPHWPGLFQIQFCNRNLRLLNDAREALIKLGFNVSNLTKPKKDKTPSIYITRKSEVKKFYKNIGFKNPKHSKKLEKHYSPMV